MGVVEVVLVVSAQPDMEDPRFVAAIDLIGRTGAKNFQLRYDDDPKPVVWIADAEWPHGRECGAAMTPLRATLRLLAQVVDGGRCAHCGKPSGVTDDWKAESPLAGLICWYVFDPETQGYRRSCEGETEGRVFGMGPDGPVGRNDPCPCGSGEKWKRCHGQ